MTLQEWLYGLGFNFVPILDNKLHRCDREGTKRDDNVWYVGSEEMLPSGKMRSTITIGDHKTGEKHSYKPDKYETFTDEERAYYAKKQKQAEEQSEKEKVLNQERAASQAQTLWDSAGNADTAHPYLIKKGISGVDRPGIRQVDDTLLIPMRDIEGKLWGIQRIWPDGTKRFLTGQRKIGCFFTFCGGSGDPAIVCEGFATGASIFAATGLTTYAAMDSGNLNHVAKSVKVPGTRIIICGDDDRWNPSGKNVGREKATEAALLVGGIAVFPSFTNTLGYETDFNDLAVSEGLGEVRRQINEAITGKVLQDTTPANWGKGLYTGSGNENVAPGNRLDDNNVGEKSHSEDRGGGACAEKKETEKSLVFVDKGARGVPRGTIENLRALLDYLGITIRYNIISKEEEINIPGMSFTKDNRANSTRAFISSWCNRFGLPIGSLNEHLNHLADQNLYNPVHEWIETVPWDGKSRLEEMFNTVNSETPLKETLMRKWFVSCIAALYEPNGVSAHGVLVFRGAQYIGKTKWFKNLAPAELGVLKDGAILHPDNKDSVFQIVTKWLVELGELDATFRKADIAQLKAFITKDEDVVRRAYAAKESHYARRTVFFASVNEQCFLNDPTGNRRFWTIECSNINYDHGINMQQFWAEIRTLYKAGETWYLTPIENESLNASNESFQQMDSIEELIRHGFKWDDVGYVRWLSATQICKEIDIERPTNQECRKAGSALRKLITQKTRLIDGIVRFPVPQRVFSVKIP